MSIAQRREAARQRLRRRFRLPEKSDADLAEIAIAHVHDAVVRSGESPVTDDEAAEIVAEDVRQMRVEKRAGQHIF